MFLEVSEGPGTGQVLGEHRETKATHSWSSRARAEEATDSLGLEATDAPLLGRAGDACPGPRGGGGGGGEVSGPPTPPPPPGRGAWLWLPPPRPEQPPPGERAPWTDRQTDRQTPNRREAVPNDAHVQKGFLWGLEQVCVRVCVCLSAFSNFLT